MTVQHSHGGVGGLRCAPPALQDGITTEGADMPIRTGHQFLEALRDERQIFMDGERIGDVTRDRRLAGAARSLAELYDMQHDPALRERMVFASPSGGDPVG